MIRRILPVQDTRLHQLSRPVEKLDQKLLDLIADMRQTLLSQKDPLGVGLAAVQVGKPIRLFLVKDRGEIITMINPEIIWKSPETNDPHSSLRSSGQATRGVKEYTMEGCLSLPNYYGPVQRAAGVRVRFQIPKKLEITTKSFSGFTAQIVQHEMDHLQGKTFVERLLEQKRGLYKLHRGQWEEVEL